MEADETLLADALFERMFRSDCPRGAEGGAVEPCVISIGSRNEARDRGWYLIKVI